MVRCARRGGCAPSCSSTPSGASEDPESGRATSSVRTGPTPGPVQRCGRSASRPDGGGSGSGWRARWEMADARRRRADHRRSSPPLKLKFSPSRRSRAGALRAAATGGLDAGLLLLDAGHATSSGSPRRRLRRTGRCSPRPWGERHRRGDLDRPRRERCLGGLGQPAIGPVVRNQAATSPSCTTSRRSSGGKSRGAASAGGDRRDRQHGRRRDLRLSRLSRRNRRGRPLRAALRHPAGGRRVSRAVAGAFGIPVLEAAARCGARGTCSRAALSNKGAHGDPLSRTDRHWRTSSSTHAWRSRPATLDERLI